LITNIRVAGTWLNTLSQATRPFQPTSEVGAHFNYCSYDRQNSICEDIRILQVQITELRRQGISDADGTFTDSERCSRLQRMMVSKLE
jgi:hypothetical protein